MNKVIVSFWEKLSFKRNISKVRQAVIDYLKGEGVQAEMKDGMVVVLLENYYYSIDFDLEGDYPRCDIFFKMESDEYAALELSCKTYIADRANTDQHRLSTVKAFNDSVIIDTHFYFKGRNMLLSLFYDYFVDLKETVNAVIGLLIDELQEKREKEEKKEKRPIGFVTNSAASKKKEVAEVAAYKQVADD